MYADFDFYTGIYFGDVLTEDIFNKYASRASEYIDSYTFGKAAKVEPADEMTCILIGKACCAVAELLKQLDLIESLASKAAAAADSNLETGAGEIKSETVGGWSQSYVTAGEYSASAGANRANKDAEVTRVIQRYLGPTGLLYRGVRGLL